MAVYMLDTDISSYVMKRTYGSVLKRLEKTAVADVCISAITKAEIMYGVEVSPRRRQDQAALDEFLRYVEVLDYPAAAALDYASIRADLKARGAMIGGNGLFIASHARSMGLTLVTKNTREFSRVEGLKIENWTDPA
ncbi:MAG: PIN domain-containing protein [Terracidiphilus sp.]|jgi:tRNA(fMet)-specific endonuclease VapC